MRVRTPGGPAHDGGAAAAAAAAAGFAGSTPLRFRTPANTPALKAGAGAGGAASPPGGLYLVSPGGGVSLGGSTPPGSLAAVPEQDAEARAGADGADADEDCGGARRLGDAMEAAAGLAPGPAPAAGMIPATGGAEDEASQAEGCLAGASSAGGAIGLQTPPCPEGFAEGAGEPVGHAESEAAEGGAGGGKGTMESAEGAEELAGAREATPPGYVPRRKTTPYMDKKLAALQVPLPPPFLAF